LQIERKFSGIKKCHQNDIIFFNFRNELKNFS
jgi:hypothetical protein